MILSILAVWFWLYGSSFVSSADFGFSIFQKHLQLLRSFKTSGLVVVKQLPGNNQHHYHYYQHNQHLDHHHQNYPHNQHRDDRQPVHHHHIHFIITITCEGLHNLEMSKQWRREFPVWRKIFFRWSYWSRWKRKKEVIQRVMEIKQKDVDSSDQDPYPRTWLIYYSLDHDILGSSKKECFYSMMLISVFEKWEWWRWQMMVTISRQTKNIT